MSVTVDQQPLPAERLGLKTVGQVLQHLRRDNRLVVHVLIDGQEPDRHRLKAIQRAPIANHTVFIETADPRTMANDVLDEVEAQLGEADRIKSASARLLLRNQIAPAIEKLGGCFTTWQHAQEAVTKIAQLLRIDLASVAVNGRTLTDLLEDFSAHLRQIRAALEDRDFAELSDLLIHRGSRACTQWRDAIRSLRAIVAA